MRGWVVMLFVIGACDETTPAPGPSGTTVAATTPSLPAPPPPEPPDPFEEIAAKRSFAEALELAVPRMRDTQDEPDLGALLFATWAARRLAWTDVSVEPAETSFKLVMKDSDAARGKRMCFRGRVVQIQKEELDENSAVFTGQLINNDYQVLRFIAAASTGDLVEGSRARICGVVTGRYSYSNAGGGTTHAVNLVGMFELPENVRR